MNNSDGSEMKENADLFSICRSFRHDIKEILKKALKQSTAVTNEQFLSELVGQCPQCRSNATQDCENVPVIEDFTVGLCLKCGYLWCLECGKPLVKDTNCTHWEICRKCGTADKSGSCSVNLHECDKLNDGILF